MKRLASIGIKNFKDGMFSSDVTELVGKAILLENIVHDDELGKAVKVQDYLLTQLSNWGQDYYLTDEDYEVKDMIFYTPEEGVEYLTIAITFNSILGIHFFLIETDGSLTFVPEMAIYTDEAAEDCYLNVAGKVLRYSYKPVGGARKVKWYGDLNSKRMFFIDGLPRRSYEGFFLANARPLSSGISFGAYSLGTYDIENAPDGTPATSTQLTGGVEYYKSYKLSTQYDDSQESEFGDLLISVTTKTAKAVSFDVKVSPSFSKRLTKIHIWRKVSADAIESTDAHELIETYDVSTNESNTSFEVSSTPLYGVKYAIEYSDSLGPAPHSIVRQRILVSDIPSSLHTNTYADGVYIKISNLGVDYYWKVVTLKQEYIEVEYDKDKVSNPPATELPPAGGLVVAGTHPMYGSDRFNTLPVTYGLTATIGNIVIDDASFNNVFVADNISLTPSQYVGFDLIPISGASAAPASEVVSNTAEYIISDTALCTYDENPAEDFSLVGTIEALTQWEIDPLVLNGFKITFTDEKPFGYGSGQFYSEEHGILRGDFPYYTHAVKYNNRLFVIDGAKIRWSELFKYDMFKPEAIYSGKNDFNRLVVFRDVLFAFSENDVVVLNYAGTEVNWRTSDTLDKIGTKYVNSIQVTPVGVFFTDGDGIYVLASTMQMGKQSYTEYQRIDEAIEDEFDFSDAAVNSLIGHYDIKKSRYVLSNSEDGKQYVFSVNSRGWFIRKSVDYPSITRSLGRYGLVESSANYKYLTRFIDGIPNDDYCYITTGWFYAGDPHNTTWFRELFILLKNGKNVLYDSVTYYAKVVLIHDDKAVADWELGDVSSGSSAGLYYGSNLQFYEDIMKINGKLKKFRLKIYSNYPIFEYDNLEITYTPTGTY